MTITQTYRLVHTARGKLSHEASRSEHDLRLLVGHANLLDSLMLELQEAEEEQDDWYNNTVSAATKEDNRQVAWQDDLEIPDSSDEEEDSDDEMLDALPITMIPIKRARSPPAQVTVDEVSDEEEDSDDDEFNEELVLCRTISHNADTHLSSPPELVHDSDDSDDDSSPSQSCPTSPPQAILEYMQPMGLPTKPQDAAEALYEDGFYIPRRNQAALVAAC